MMNTVHSVSKETPSAAGERTASYTNPGTARRVRISRNVLAHVDRVEIGGVRYAMKRFAAGARIVWAREAASHALCPHRDVPAIQACGIDVQHHGWLCTPWIDAHNARMRLSHGDHGLREFAQLWIAGFQGQLAIHGYRWADPAMRNLLVNGEGDANSPYEFKVIDYTVSALKDDSALDKSIEYFMRMAPGEHPVDLSSSFNDPAAA